MTSTVSADPTTGPTFRAPRPVSPRWRALRRWFRREDRGPPPCPAADPTQDPPWLTQLVAGVVHEMNSPVGVMASCADTMEALCHKVEAASDDPEVVAHLRTLRQLAALQQQTATRVKDTVQSLERFVDLDRSECRPVDLGASVDAALGVLGARQDARLVVDVAPNTPRPTTSARLLNRVLLHVLDRARRAAGAGGQIHVAIHPTGPSRVAVSVSDTGAAIPECEMDHLSSPRLATRDARVALDLEWATSERALRAIGGRLMVHSGHDRTTVTLLLPLRAPEENDGPR